MFRCGSLFSRENYIRHLPFLLDELCEQNLLFPFLPVCIIMSPLRIGTLSLGIFSDKER